MRYGELPPTDVPALMIWASTGPAIPLFLCCLPLGPWSSPFHILVLVLSLTWGAPLHLWRNFWRPPVKRGGERAPLAVIFKCKHPRSPAAGARRERSYVKCNSLFRLSAFCTEQMWRVGLALMKPCGYLWKPTSEDLLKENCASVFGLSQICARKHNQFQRDEMYFYCWTCAEMLFKRIQRVTHQRVFVLVF